MRHIQKLLGLPALLVAFSCVCVQSARADQTFTVTNSADSGAGSLRWALTEPCVGVRTVNFTITHQVIDLAAPLEITGPTTIKDGHRITISGGGSVRPFIVNSGASLRLQGLTVANGSAVEGGAIYNDGGDLRVVRCTLLNNTATRGGAIYNNGGTSVVNTCTLSGNSAARGGVVYNAGGSSRLQYVTACENSASELGGVLYSDGGSDIVHRSILWDNAAPACATPPAYSTQMADANSASVSVTQCIIQGGYPGYYDSTGLVVWDFAKDIVQEMPNNLDVDPLLGPLGYPRYSGDWQLGVPDIQKANTNEVSTMMYEPLPGSPAHFAIYGFYDNDDWNEDPDDVYEQRGSWLRRQVSGGNEVSGASIGSCFIGFQNPYILGVHPNEGYPTTNYWGEAMWETNIIQSTEVLQPFQPVTMTVTSPYCPPISYEGGEVFFVIPDTPTGPSCTISPNPAKIAADGTVTFTPVANGYVGTFTITAHVLYHPPYYDYPAGKEITLTNTPGQHLVVTNEAADSTFGSLRWATENVAEGGRITFDGDLTCPLTQQSGKEQPTVLYDIDGEDHEVVITAQGTASVMTVGRGGSPNPITISNVTIADGFFSDAGFSYRAGGAYIRNGDISFINVKFRNNRGDNGGALSIDTISHLDGALNLKLINCIFEDNTASSRGGAFFLVDSDAEIDFINCTFSGNQAAQGGAIYNQHPGFFWQPDGMRQRISNCIFWDNTATSYPTIHTEAGGGTNSVTFTSSDIPNAFPSGTWDAALGINGGGNIAADPLFADAANSDFSLSTGSPCINAGSNALLPSEITEDIAGNQRIADSTVDMGAYEAPYIVTVTFNANGGTTATASADFIEGLAYGAFPEVTRAGYSLIGWTNAAGATVSPEDLVSRSTTSLTAQWTLYGTTIDQRNENYGNYFNNQTSGWQSFTAGEDGYLAAVALYVYSYGTAGGYSGGSDWTATLAIYAGTGTGGTLLASQPVSGTGVNQRPNYYLETPPKLTAGGVYTIAIRNPSVALTYRASGNLYAGGRCSFNSAYDLHFVTYMMASDWSDATYRDSSFTVSSSVISTAAQLAQFAWLVNNGETYAGRTLTLADDIQLSPHYWVPIGGSPSACFEGTFDGAGHSVSGIRIDDPTADYQGLFGCVGASAEIRNLSVANVDISGRDHVGGIAGSATGVIRNCSSSGSVSGSTAGGLVGSLLSGGSLQNSFNSGSVTGTGDFVGGLVGNNAGSVSNAYWKQTGTAPFTLGATGSGSSGTETGIQSFGSAPGTLAAPVTVGDVVTDQLSSALNAWVASVWTPGCGLFRWAPGTVSTYPTLAAEYEPVEVTFNANGGSPDSATLTYAIGVAYSAFPTVERTGYTFDAWTDSEGATITTATLATSSVTTLYARWTANSYTVTFDKQSGTGGSDSVSATYASAMPAATAPARTGYSFGGYWDATSGGTQYYSAAMASLSTWDKTSAATLYARWTAHTYTVAYNGNGSTAGATASSAHTYGVVGALTPYGFARLGFAFTGWNTAVDGVGAAYADGESVLNLTPVNGATVTLYAQWVEVLAAEPGVGTGADGTLLVSGTNLVDSVKTKLTANGARGQTVISVASAAGLGAGDEILLICLQGTGAGAYEFATVAAVAAGQLTLNSALQNSFNVAAGDRVMVQRVPNYTDVTVKTGGMLTASAWVGGASSWTPGGVVAFRVKGTLTIEAGGRVTADALGFAGGAGVSSTTQSHGYQGESYGLTVGTKSRDPNLGGGGGGLYFATDGDGGGGGGGGGHGTAGAPGADVEPYHGLGGSTYGSHDMTSMFLGSGGGAGGTDDDGAGSSKGGDGGHGGGIVYIAAYALTVDGTLSAAGGNGQTVIDTDGDKGDESGGGGGGSGGTVVLATAISPSQTAEMLVPGGNGGGVESGSMFGGSGGLGIFAYAYVDPGLWSDAAYRDPTFTADSTLIRTPFELAQFAWLVNQGETFAGRTVTLANDIDLFSHEWVAIGSDGARFEGTFDGAGYTIHNIRIDRPAVDYQGFFGCVGSAGAVRNLSISDCAISGQTYVGGIAGRSFGTLSNCTVMAGCTVTGSSFSVGGIVGCAEGALSDCVNGAAVTGGGGVGGVAGEANGATTNCSNSGSVLGNSSVGGIAGIALGTLADCVNSGAVEATGGEATGGIAGSAAGSVLRCTNTGSVEGGLAAGVVGQHSGERIDSCRNAGAVTAMAAGGIVTMGQSLVVNCVNHGAVFGVLAGGIACELHEGAIVRNCANAGRIEGMSVAGGLASQSETGSVMENCVNSGAVTASDDAGGLVAYHEGTATNCYWKQTGVAPFTVPVVGTNNGTLSACESFGDAPGTLTAPVTAGDVTTDRLAFALNAWVSAAWHPDGGLESWSAGTATDYPSLVPAIVVGDAVIPQTLSDRFMAGTTAAQIDATLATYITNHPATTAEDLGGLLAMADAMGFTFGELAQGDAILAFSPIIACTQLDIDSWTLTFRVANGIDPTAAAAMNRLAGSTAGLLKVERMDEPGGASTALPATIEFHADGTATASFAFPNPPPRSFFRLALEHQPE